MKAAEFERLKEAILNGIGVENLKKFEVISAKRKMSFKNTIDAFLLNMAKYVFGILYQHQLHGQRAILQITNDGLKEYDDYIAKHFIYWGEIYIVISSRKGVLFTVDYVFANLEYQYLQSLPKKKKKNGFGETISDDQRQQFKWAARQGSRKK